MFFSLNINIVITFMSSWNIKTSWAFSCFAFSHCHALLKEYSVFCTRSHSRRSKESQRSHRHRSHHRSRHKSRTRSRSGSADHKHKHSQRSSCRRSVSTTRKRSPTMETSNRRHATGHHHKKKKAKRKRSRVSTPTSSDTSPPVEPVSERRLITLGSEQRLQQQLLSDKHVGDKTVNHNSDLTSDEDRWGLQKCHNNIHCWVIRAFWLW